MKFTEEQMEMARAIMEKTAPARKAVTLYKKNDEGLAMFRVQAMNMIDIAVICKITGKKYPTKLKKYLNSWSCDGSGGIGEAIIELFDQIENC